MKSKMNCFGKVKSLLSDEISKERIGFGVVDPFIGKIFLSKFRIPLWILLPYRIFTAGSLLMIYIYIFIWYDSGDNNYYLVYLSYWNYTVMNLYLITMAVITAWYTVSKTDAEPSTSSLLKFLEERNNTNQVSPPESINIHIVDHHQKEKSPLKSDATEEGDHPDLASETATQIMYPKKQTGGKSPLKTSTSIKVAKFLWCLSCPLNMHTLLLYWTLMAKSITWIGILIHLIIPMLSIFELCITNFRWNLLHILYICILGLAYGVTYVSYWAVDPLNNIIYHVINFTNDPITATIRTALAQTCVMFLSVIIWLVDRFIWYLYWTFLYHEQDLLPTNDQKTSINRKALPTHS